jgi:hypothetical protein
MQASASITKRLPGAIQGVGRRPASSADDAGAVLLESAAVKA